MTFETVVATTGEMAVPPRAPPDASLAAMLWVVAVRVRSPAFDSAAPGVGPSVPSRPAVVSSLTTLTAIEAPMPRLAPPMSSSGSAWTVVLRSVVADSARFPPAAFTTAPRRRSAVLLPFMFPTDSDPARATSSASPTPEIAWMSKVSWVGVVASTRIVGASRVAFPPT